MSAELPEDNNIDDINNLSPEENAALDENSTPEENTPPASGEPLFTGSDSPSHVDDNDFQSISDETNSEANLMQDSPEAPPLAPPV